LSWFLHSGIQEADGGVARYYRADLQANAPVSTEITGYAASAYAYLYRRTGEQRYLDAAAHTARFLVSKAWDSASSTFPFEPGSGRAYFFDIGIVIRGLLAVWRITRETALLERAKEASLSLAFDFMGDGHYHPIVALPDKQPLPHEKRWSREPGCYQLKSALAWWNIGESCGEEPARRVFLLELDRALASHSTFLPGTDDVETIMDRLHAYCYFLEALLAVPDRGEVRQALAAGVEQVGTLLREIGPTFERSDVNAQLLRVRLVAHRLNALPLDQAAACQEAEHAASFRIASEDPRLDGGFWFGRKGSAMLPYANPVSTAFCLQALDLWERHRSGDWDFTLDELI
jgi:hypothetical protein